MSTRTVTVTRKHITEGKMQDCANCPLALAITESTGVPTEVGIWGAWLVGELYRYMELPQEAQQFIDKFDQGQTVEPFTFQLPTPTP